MRSLIFPAAIPGTVKNTIMLKDYVADHSRNITTLDDRELNLVSWARVANIERHLGTVHCYPGEHAPKPFSTGYIVTFHECSLYVVNPLIGKVLAHHHDLGAILDVGINGEEVFVLRQHRDFKKSIICLSINQPKGLSWGRVESFQLFTNYELNCVIVSLQFKLFKEGISWITEVGERVSRII